MAEPTPGRNPLPRNTETPLENDTPGVESAVLNERLPVPSYGGYQVGVSAVSSAGGLRPMPYSSGSFMGNWGKKWGHNWIARDLMNQLLCYAKIYQGKNIRKNAVQGRSMRSIPAALPSQPDWAYALEIADFCDYIRGAMDGSYASKLWQMQDCDEHGHKIAKIDYGVDESPRWKGKWRPKRMNIWPNQGYQFMMDEYGVFCAVQVKDGGETRNLDPRTFAILTFRPVNDNPYGTVLYSPVCEAYWKAVQANPELIALMTQYGRPGLYVIAPELKDGMPVANIAVFDANGERAEDRDGNPMELSPLQYNALVIREYKAGTAVTLAGGSSIGLLQATPGGESLFRFLKEDTDSDMMSVILGTDQLTESKGATTEGNAGSSETILGYGILDSRRSVEELDQQIMAPAVELNYGKKGLQYLPASDIGSMANPRLIAQQNAWVGYINNGAADIDQDFMYCVANGIPFKRYLDAPRVVEAKAATGNGGNQNNAN